MTHTLLFSFVAITACANGGAEPVSGAAAVQNRTAEYFKCNDGVDLGAFKNTQWNACSEAELERTEASLNRVYRKLELSLSDPRQVLPNADRDRGAKLLVSQGSWRKFRDDFCEFRAGSGEAPNAENISLECRIDVTREQVTRLEGAL